MVNDEGRIELRSAEVGDHGWVLERHAYLFEDEEAWGEKFLATIASVLADFLEDHDPRRERAWIAELDGERAGSVYCVRRAEEVAQLRLLFVDSGARGHGVGGKLVDSCIDYARAKGYTRMVLWTNSTLDSARRIYDAAGFEQTSEEPHPAFPEGTMAQELWLDL